MDTWGCYRFLMEKMSALTRDDVDSVVMYRKIVLDLASQCTNPGRMVIIHFFPEASFSEEIVRNVTDGIP